MTSAQFLRWLAEVVDETDEVHNRIVAIAEELEEIERQKESSRKTKPIDMG